MLNHVLDVNDLCLMKMNNPAILRLQQFHWNLLQFPPLIQQHKHEAEQAKRFLQGEVQKSSAHDQAYGPSAVDDRYGRCPSLSPGVTYTVWQGSDGRTRVH